MRQMVEKHKMLTWLLQITVRFAEKTHMRLTCRAKCALIAKIKKVKYDDGIMGLSERFRELAGGASQYRRQNPSLLPE